MVNDPYERRNVVDEPQNAGLVKALREALMGFVQATPGYFADLKASIEVKPNCVWV